VGQATSDGFAPGNFSVMDFNVVCALSNVVLNRSFEWRGRPKLEAVVSRYAECPSVTSTADGMNKGMPAPDATASSERMRRYEGGRT
jgi:hypothetical protein